MWLRCLTDSGPRITEPCSFHHHTERGLMSRDLDGVQSTQIPVPESLNRAVLTTCRKSLGLCHATKMPHGFWSQNQWTMQFSSPYRKRAYVKWFSWCISSPRIPALESLNRAVFTTYRKSQGLCHVTKMPHGFWSQNHWTLQILPPIEIWLWWFLGVPRRLYFPALQ